jgi:hypothetical protein
MLDSPLSGELQRVGVSEVSVTAIEENMFIYIYI